MGNYTQKERCAAALRAIMRYKRISMAELARGSGLSYRTVENYYYGRNDMSNAKSYNIIEIEHFLDIDGRILTGSMSIEDYYLNQEKPSIKSEHSAPPATDYRISIDGDQIILEFYEKELKKNLQ